MTNLLAVPARLPGLRARHVGDGLDDRHARQPHRERWACELSERITHSMLTTPCCPTCSNITDRLSQSQAQLSSGKRILKPSDDPFGTSRALALPRRPRARTPQYQTNVNDGSAWLDADRHGARRHHRALVQRARDLIVQGANDTSGAQPRTRRSPPRSTRSIESIKSEGEHPVRRPVHLLRHEDDDPAVHARTAPIPTPATPATVMRADRPRRPGADQRRRGSRPRRRRRPPAA